MYYLNYDKLWIISANVFVMYTCSRLMHLRRLTELSLMLFSALIPTNLTSCCKKLINSWYFKRYVGVRWNGFNSSAFNVYSDVRQGIVLQPMLFNLYGNKIITCLQTSVAGCYFVSCYWSCIMHTDDQLLLSGSVLDAQAMLYTCGCTGKQLGIAFNANKIVLHDNRSCLQLKYT